MHWYSVFLSCLLNIFCPACHLATAEPPVDAGCVECLNGGTFLGDGCECPEGFSGAYCEVEGVLLFSMSPPSVAG